MQRLTLRNSVFHHGRTPAIFPIGGKTRRRQRTETIRSSIGSKGMGGNESPFLFASDDLRFDLSPLKRCLGLRTSRFAFISPDESNYRPTRQIWVIAYGTSIQRSRETYDVWASSENHSFTSIILQSLERFFSM